MVERCENCRFWFRLTENMPSQLVATFKGTDPSEGEVPKNDYGQCRRLPPRVSERSVESSRKGKMLNFILTEFPDVPKNCWCGEWQERPPTRPEPDDA